MTDRAQHGGELSLSIAKKYLGEPAPKKRDRKVKKSNADLSNLFEEEVQKDPATPLAIPMEFQDFGF
jgi:hypothetical protein